MSGLAGSSLNSIPQPGQLQHIPVAKLATLAGIDVLLLAAVVYLKFIRKSHLSTATAGTIA